MEQKIAPSPYRRDSVNEAALRAEWQNDIVQGCRAVIDAMKSKINDTETRLLGRIEAMEAEVAELLRQMVKQDT